MSKYASRQVQECLSEQLELCADSQSVSMTRQQSNKRSRLYLQNSRTVSTVSRKWQPMFEARCQHMYFNMCCS